VRSGVTESLYHRGANALRTSVVVEAALQGLGILYAYDDERVDEAMAGGRLKRILADWSLMSPGLYLYYSNRRHPQPALRAFIDCLLDRDGDASK
jgi:DNA-binding transcriptional LysR family regulator